MNYYLKILILLQLLLLFTAHGYSQQEIILSENYNNQLFSTFEKQIHKVYSVDFYYQKQWTDSIRITQNRSNESLIEVLDNTFRDLNIDYLFIDSKIVLVNQKLTKKTIYNKQIIPDTISNYAEIEYDEPEQIESEAVRKNNSDETLVVGKASLASKGDKAVLSGYIKEVETGEPLIGAAIYIEDLEVGVASNFNGYYSVIMPKGKHTISYQSLGKEKIVKNILIHSDGSINIELRDQVTQLKGIVITAERNNNVASTRMGLERITMSNIREIPSVMGETDVMKVAVLLPGVQTVSEGAAGFNVRGGNIDQNLVMYNNAPIFNANHLFGFFSAFNPDMIDEFELYKSGIPAEYGGRLSSIFDIKSKNGNKKELEGHIGISPVTTKFTIEAPIVREESSIIIGGRTTYSDWILEKIKNKDIRKSSANFYDFSAKLDLKINNKNTLDYSFYLSHDYFKLASDTVFNYQNIATTLSWKRNINDNLNMNTHLIYSQYEYIIESEKQTTEDFKQDYQLRTGQVKMDFFYVPKYNHNIKFGLHSALYDLNPGSKKPANDFSQIIPRSLENEKAIESSIYIGDEYNLNPRISIYGGLRYSIYNFLGPQTVYQYANDISMNAPETIIDSLVYSGNEFIENYSGPEFRFSMRYKTSQLSSIKLGYNRMRQYVHMLTNTTTMSPTDTWKLSDPYIKPQIGDQYSIGFYKDFRYSKIETSVEVYYKKSENLLDYKGGAQLNMNPYLEADVIDGIGKAYGVEFLVKKQQGKLTGWLSYTYSRSLIKVEGQFEDETINDGEYFPTNYDKPHDFTSVLTYKFTRRFSFSTNTTYNTGRPITYPIAAYRMSNMQLLQYSNRNEYRIPDYFRTDVSFKMEGNLKRNKFVHSSLIFSVYNVFGRDNVYSIYFKSEGNKVQGYKMSIFAQPIFSISLNFDF